MFLYTFYFSIKIINSPYSLAYHTTPFHTLYILLLRLHALHTLLLEHASLLLKNQNEFIANVNKFNIIREISSFPSLAVSRWHHPHWYGIQSGLRVIEKSHFFHSVSSLNSLKNIKLNILSFFNCRYLNIPCTLIATRCVFVHLIGLSRICTVPCGRGEYREMMNYLHLFEIGSIRHSQ